jgi:hypothetical protein
LPHAVEPLEQCDERRQPVAHRNDDGILAIH